MLHLSIELEVQLDLDLLRMQAQNAQLRSNGVVEVVMECHLILSYHLILEVPQKAIEIL